MPQLALSCFGAFQATLHGEPLMSFQRTKVQALLTYLILESDRPHSRQTLATLLWPLDAEASARNSLRQTLYELRKLLGDHDGSHTPFLLITRQTVQFNSTSDYIFDVASFLRCIAQGDLARATTYYRDDLLMGFSCESEPFEEWLRLTRERLRNLAVDAAFELTEQYLQQGDTAQARQYAHRQLALEPWREEAHRQLMTALALSSERSAALVQYETCRRVLAEELGVEPDAETTLLYEEIKAGNVRSQTPALLPTHSISPSHAPAVLATSDLPRQNLPPQPTPFVGRAAGLEQITARLHDPTCRLLTLIGPGGIGKTRLAIQAAQKLLTDMKQHAIFADGIIFVALAPVSSPDLLLSTIADALDFTFYGNSDPVTQLSEYLRSKKLLLVLDNFEHLLSGVELVSNLLAVASGVKVLATSREPLNLYEEWLFPLGGMRLPDEDSHEDGALLATYSSVQLFVHCAQRAHPDFDLAVERNHVVRICRLVEGIPLGIELAAAWRKVLTSEQIAQEVARNLDFLSTSLRNVPARHRSMRAVFEHSWSLLSVVEQEVLPRLAIFRGGFEQEAAEVIANTSFLNLVTLAEKLLLQRMPSGRYQMHELLRQFAEEKLRANPAEDERVQGEHCRYYMTFLQQQEFRLKGPEHLAAMLAIEAEIENIRIAWEWAVTQDKLDEMERALESLSYFHETKCWFDQAAVLFRTAAEALATHLPSERRQILWAKICAKQGAAQLSLSGEGGRPAFSGTTQLLEQCLVILQRSGETGATGDIFLTLSGLVVEPLQGQKLRTSALAIYEKNGDRWHMARTLEALGFNANILGKYEEAKQYYRRGIALCNEIGDQRKLGDIQAVLAEVCRALGEYAEATVLAEASLAARTAVANKRGIAYSLYVLGAIAWRMGNLEEANRYSRQSRDVFVEIGLLGGVDFALGNLGNIACALGDYAEARRHFQKILQTSLTRNMLVKSQNVPWALAGMAEVLCQEGQPEQAVELIEHVLRHPNAWQEAKDQAAKLLAKLTAQLPKEVVVAAQEQAWQQELAAAVSTLVHLA